MLGQNVLVLNRLWQAVHITTARRAFCLVCGGRARVLDDDFATYDWEAWRSYSVAVEPETGGRDFVRGVRACILVPRIVQLHHFDKVPRSRVKFTRSNIYLRDRHRCQYCGRQGKKSELNIDHLVPRSRGGRSTWDNVVVACISCNHRKGDRLPEEVGMVPTRQPKRPRWHPALATSGAAAPHPQWRPFLEVAYWPGQG